MASLEEPAKADFISQSLAKLKPNGETEKVKEMNKRSLSARGLQQARQAAAISTSATLRNTQNEVYLASPVPTAPKMPLLTPKTGIAEKEQNPMDLDRAAKIKMAYYKQTPQFQKDLEQMRALYEKEEERKRKVGYFLIGAVVILGGGLTFYFLKDKVLSVVKGVSPLNLS